MELRMCRDWVWLGILLGSLPLSGQIRGPMVGWVWDSRQECIRPVLGIAGSSVLGKAIDAGGPVKQAAISGREEFAVVLLGEAMTARVVDLRLVETPSRPLGAPDGAQQIVLSPRGEAAVLLYSDPTVARVVAGLPSQPAIIREIDLSVEGLPARAAISDDGTLLALAYPEQKQVTFVDEHLNRIQLPEQIVVRSLSFLEKSGKLLIAGEDGVTLVQGAPVNLQSQRIWETSSHAVAGLSENRILLVDPAIQSVVEVNLEAGSLRVAQCPCAPTAIVRMSGNGIFRLTEVSAEPLWLLEVTEAGLRTVFVPPDAGLALE
ncbi:MAG: hypothetical protein NZV14_11465 [Bryobacteraceae bacterium]|nr:hypothetical protein [Bryobacteraceae bacterium]MDW8378772.1 hypothetical protein [Bryobacterales bacterium]